MNTAPATTTTAPATVPAPLLLEKYRSAAREAYRGTSFSMEKRGDDMVSGYSEELAADMETVTKYGRDPETYRERYERKFSAWIAAKSRVISVMIAGPSNFPAARNQKRLNSEGARYDDFRAWRETVLAAMKKDHQKRKEREAIEAQGGELAAARNELEKMKKAHELMKTANAILRKHKGKDSREALKAAGLSEKAAEELQKPDFCGRSGFPQYALTNSLARIKDQEARVKKIEQREAAADLPEGGAKELIFEGGRIVYNVQAERVQIFHDEKPGEEVRNQLKKSGFRWSPFYGCWQRQLTSNGKYEAARITGTKPF